MGIYDSLRLTSSGGRAAGDAGGRTLYNLGNVGIGTTSPTNKLDVAGHINSTESYKLDGATVLSNTGTGNTFVGQGAGVNNTGVRHTFSGYCAGYSNTTGNDNTFSGCAAGYHNTTGSWNTFLGTEAGWANGTGARNVFIGYRAGYNEIGSNKLYIANSSTNTPLIYGDFSTGRVGIGTASPTQKLDVAGAVNLNSGISSGIALYVNGSEALWYNGTFFSWGFGGNANYFAHNVGIGTANPQYTLDVIGDIRATGSVYYGGTAGNQNGTAYNKPDYVFEEGYDIMSIDEVEEYLKKENHLPWVTSANQEKQENGGAINITRMAFETVETAENLQMQVIELNKIVKEQAALINAEQKRIKALEETAAQSQSLKQRLDMLQNAIEQNHVSSAKEMQQ